MSAGANQIYHNVLAALQAAEERGGVEDTMDYSELMLRIADEVHARLAAANDWPVNHSAFAKLRALQRVVKYSVNRLDASGNQPQVASDLSIQLIATGYDEQSNPPSHLITTFRVPDATEVK